MEKVSIKIFLVMLGCLIQTSLLSQSVYFNETIDLGNDWGSGMSIIANDTVYHIAAITGPGKMISIVEVGQSGDSNWIKKYGDPQERWYPGSPGSLCPYFSGGYTLGGGIDSNDQDYGLLLRFNSEFDTLFTKRFVNSNFTVILTCSKPTLDGGIILTGEDYSSGSNTDFILLKTDSVGNELWRSIKNIGIDDRGWSVIQTPDSGFVVGGFTYNPGAYHKGDPLIVKFDKNGTYLWSRNPGGPYQDGKAMVCLNDDSTFTVLTTIADSIYIPDFDYARICVIKYSQDGVELWKKKYGSSIGGNFVFNIKPMPDGGYICCGTQSEPGNYDVDMFGWLLRLDAEGDSIWFRRYSYNDDHPFYSNQLFDVSITQDGGIVATGNVFDFPTNSLKRIWILKLDSIGCEYAGCDSTVGIEEDRTVGLYDDKKGGLKIWPNPAREILNVEFLILNSGSKSSTFNLQPSITVYDIYGREMISEHLSSTRMGGGREGGWTVDVSHLPPGIYFIVVRDERNVIGTGKFVVGR